MNTCTNHEINNAIEYLNIAFHENVNNKISFGIRQETLNTYVLYLLNYNRNGEEIKSDITVPIKEKLILSTLKGLIQQYLS